MSFNTNCLKEWPDRIKSRMKALGLTQETLANKMGMTRGAVGHYLSGRRMPPMRQFEKLATILKTDAAWLQFGIVLEVDPITQEAKFSMRKEVPSLHPIPIISWEQIDDIASINQLNREKITQWVPRLYSDGLQSFALKVKGDSMTSPSGHMDSFREGDIVQFDNDRGAVHGDYVIAIMPNAKEATFKQYVVDGGVQYLKPLNPQYPIVQIGDDTKICGVMVYHIAK